MSNEYDSYSITLYESFGLTYFSTLYSPLVTFLQIESTNSLLYRLFSHLREVFKMIANRKLSQPITTRPIELDQSEGEFLSFNLKTCLSNKTSNRIPFFYFLFKFIVLSQKLKITGRARELRHVACSINQTVLMHSSCSLLPSRIKVACMTLFTAGGGFRAISNRCCHDPISLIQWGASF